MATLGVIGWVAASCGAAVLITIALFAFGILYPRSIVTRMQRDHDAEIERLDRRYEADIRRERADGDYYRQAAQSCAAAVAHREGQVRTLTALLSKYQEGR